MHQGPCTKQEIDLPQEERSLGWASQHSDCHTAIAWQHPIALEGCNMLLQRDNCCRSDVNADNTSSKRQPNYHQTAQCHGRKPRRQLRLDEGEQEGHAHQFSCQQAPLPSGHQSLCEGQRVGEPCLREIIGLRFGHLASLGHRFPQKGQEGGPPLHCQSGIVHSG